MRAAQRWLQQVQGVHAKGCQCRKCIAARADIREWYARQVAGEKPLSAAALAIGEKIAKGAL